MDSSPLVKTKSFTHPVLNQEVTAIGGHYVFIREERFPFNGREVLYLYGYGIFDTTCCGAGGYGYAQVPGFVVKWKHATGPDGLPVSEVEPISDKAIQKEIRQYIEKKEILMQVNFY